MSRRRREIAEAKSPTTRIMNGPLRSVMNPEMTFPIVFENEYIPTASPIKNGVAPNDSANGLMMGSCENKSKNEKKTIR